jgi:3-deoxy-D-manno-octulosonate 8-phosphate phosphatase (KDO 8-P phosphatase)
MPLNSADLTSRAQKIKLLAMDVDGVLTGGEIIVLDSGEEIKFWSAKDRLIISLLRERKHPLTLAWITGRQSETVARAAEDLGVRHVVQKCADKKEALQAILDQYKLTSAEAAFIGDDLIDIPAMKSVGLSICPADAATDVLKMADYISPRNGGQGLVREAIELILKAQKQWDSLIENFIS